MSKKSEKAEMTTDQMAILSRGALEGDILDRGDCGGVFTRHSPGNGGKGSDKVLAGERKEHIYHLESHFERSWYIGLTRSDRSAYERESRPCDLTESGIS